MSDWKAEREAIRARRQKAIEGPYFVSHDDAHDSPDHANSGLAKVDTWRSADWWVARLCEWPTAEFLAASWEDIGTLLAKSEEDEREIEQLRGENDLARRAFELADLVILPNGIGEMNALQIAKKLDYLGAELALRDQRISELERHARNMEETVDNVRIAMGFETTHWQVLPGEVELMRKERDSLKTELLALRKRINEIEVKLEAERGRIRFPHIDESKVLRADDED